MAALNGTSNATSGELSATAKEFVPLTSGAQPYESEPTFIQVAAERLWLNPEDFYQIADTLLKHFDQCAIDDATFTALVDELFNQCIKLENFQNSGARLCAHLSSQLRTDFNGGFRIHLLIRCQKEYNAEKQKLSETDAGRRRLIGFTIFVSELVIQLGEVVSKALSPRVIELVKLLLSCRTDEAVKWAANVLKLGGGTFDTHCRKEMSQLVENIKDLILDNDAGKPLSRSVRQNLLNVVELRAAKWVFDDSESETFTCSANNPYANYQVDELTYTPTGEPVWYEEDVFEDQGGPYEYYEGADVGAYGEYGAGNAYYDARQTAGYESGDFQNVEQLQHGLQHLEVVHDGTEEYVIEPDEMDPDMLDAYELFMADKEKSQQNTAPK